MARGLFGARKRGQLEGTADWPRLPVFEAAEGETRPRPLPPPATGDASASIAPVATAKELLEQIAAFRGAVSDSFYEVSKDYQMLCNLTQADLTACDEIVAELRRRLAGDIHYDVLAKLDEALALVAAHIGPVPSPRPTRGEG